METMLDKERFDTDTGMAIVIDPKDTEQLVHKVIVHDKCGNKHIDQDKFATFNHQKHLCHFCDEYFRDTERAVGIA